MLHSGTVGATLTGAGYGIPGIAVSLEWSEDREYHWDVAATYAAAAVEWASKPDGGPRVLNINVPNRPLAEILGVREAELAPHGEVWVASAEVTGGRPQARDRRASPILLPAPTWRDPRRLRVGHAP